MQVTGQPAPIQDNTALLARGAEPPAPRRDPWYAGLALGLMAMGATGLRLRKRR